MYVCITPCIGLGFVDMLAMTYLKPVEETLQQQRRVCTSLRSLLVHKEEKIGNMNIQGYFSQYVCSMLNHDQPRLHLIQSVCSVLNHDQLRLHLIQSVCSLLNHDQPRLHLIQSVCSVLNHDQSRLHLSQSVLEGSVLLCPNELVTN